jgi:uncharacterized membrane protein
MDLTNSAPVTRRSQAAALQSILLRVENNAVWLVAVMMVGYTVILSAASFAKYNAYGMGFDLALYEQQIWNTANGRWFETSVFSFTNNALGVDLQLIEAPLAAAYALVPSIYTLLFLQSAALALGALPVYLMAREKLGSGLAGAGLGLVYLLYPVVVNTNLYELRLRSFAVAPLLFALYFLETRRLRWFYLALLLALLCRTDIGLTVAMVGIYALWRRRSWAWSIVPIAVGLLWVVLGVFVIVPRLSSGAPYLFTSIYYNLGATPAEIVTTLVTRPLYVVQQVVTPGKIEYLNGLLAPVAFLALLNPPALLMAAPTLGLNLLSPSRLHWDLTHGYSIIVVPFVFYATVMAIAWVRARGAKGFWGTGAGLGIPVGAAIVAALVVNLAWGNATTRWIARKPSPRVALVREIAAQIPADAPLATSSLVAPVLPPRRALYYFPGNQSYGASNLGLAEYLLADRIGANEEATRALAEIRRDPRWQVVVEREGLILLRQSLP